jgi:hypothetical protein
MYRIYMTVDMVLAITHSKIRRERYDKLYKERIESTVTKYEKHDERERREKIINSDKNNNCMDMFRFW